MADGLRRSAVLLALILTLGCGSEPDRARHSHSPVFRVALDAGFVGDFALVALPDERRGAALHLAVSDATRDAAKRLHAAFNARVTPYERATLHLVDRIPRTVLGKVERGKVERAIGRKDNTSTEGSNDGPPAA